MEGALKAVMEVKLNVKAQMKAMEHSEYAAFCGSHCRQ